MLGTKNFMVFLPSFFRVEASYHSLVCKGSLQKGGDRSPPFQHQYITNN
jgi:hypothetical protein